MSVHSKGHDLNVTCRTLATPDGVSFPVLRVGPVAFFASKDQLRRIRDVLADFLCEAEEVSLDDPSWDEDDAVWSTPDALDLAYPDLDPTPDAHWTRMAPITGGCDVTLDPYVPTERDWQEYNEWCATVDAIDECNDASDGESPA
jgi:hypothetical protein